MTTTKNTKVTLRTRTVGQAFGTVGQIVARNGRVLAETETCPYGMTGPALDRAQAIAVKRGYVVVER